MVSKLDKYKTKSTTHRDYFTTTELTHLFEVHKFTIHKWVASGKLKAKKNRRKHTNYKFYKNWIEQNFQGYAKQMGTHSVEAAYIKIAFCNSCDIKFTWDSIKKVFNYEGTDDDNNRYCQPCTERSMASQISEGELI